MNCKKKNIGGTQKRKVPKGLFIPLSAKSDQSQFSHNNINTLSTENVVRINEMITWWENLWSAEILSTNSEQILSTNSLRKYMEISLENLYLDIGAEGIITMHSTHLF